MASKNVVGTIRKVVINGTPYRATADINLTHIVSAWENSNVPTSGDNMRKMVRRSQTVEGVTLNVNTDEVVELTSIAESLDNVTLAFTLASGDTWRATGTIEIENVESEEGRATVQLLPVNIWTPSVGEVS